MEKTRKQNWFINFIQAFTVSEENANNGRVTDEGLTKAEKAELNNVRKTQETLKNRIKLPSLGDTHPEKAENLDRKKSPKAKPTSKGHPTIGEDKELGDR